MAEQEHQDLEKHSFRAAWKSLKTRSKVYQIFVHLFALAGLAIIGAWGVYQLGLTNNKGAVDKNNRYLADYKTQTGKLDSAKIFDNNIQQYVKLAALNKFYPTNAHLMMEANPYNFRNDGITEMFYAANVYMKDAEYGSEYKQLVDELQSVLNRYSDKSTTDNLVPWMNEPAWPSLKAAIVKDKALIDEAARLSGVEPRLIVGCLVGEQIRLFNSKREMVKKYLGPVKVLSVQSQFSFGVNGIKDFTAMQVEKNLKDSASVYYMGKQYEHILDFKTADPQTERFTRLTDYHNHLYSYIYTGCILHQTMLQWKRAGYDIANRPDILFTLFNLGFAASKPGPSPQCGGSHISANGKVYTFGAIGYDFYFSGELAKEFPLQASSFVNE